jgi:hypothetical protein
MALANHAPANPIVLAPPVQPEAPPSPPPCPTPKTSLNRFVEMHVRAEQDDKEGTLEDYSEYVEGPLVVRLSVLRTFGAVLTLLHAGRHNSLHQHPLSLTCRRSAGSASR